MSFADMLKKELKSKGITQGELSQKTGITASTISRYMNSKGIPSIGSVHKIASVLDVSSGYLLEITNADKNASLSDTASLMVSPDYQDRFRAEYIQTKIRYERLKSMCDKYEAAKLSGEDVDKFLGFTPKCPVDLLREQLMAMSSYIHILEVRAVIEGIDLNN